MKKTHIILLATALGLGPALAACGDDSDGDTNGDGDGDGDNATGGGGGADPGGTGGETNTTFDFSTREVDIDGTPTTVITNEAGFTLYTYANDTPGEEATFVGASWPPVEVADPTVGAGLSASDFGVTPNGQSTYDGWPLYTYSGNSAPGDANAVSPTWPVAVPK